jgi:hypothetical protein
MGLLYLNPANCLKVAMARKNETPQMRRHDILKNYNEVEVGKSTGRGRVRKTYPEGKRSTIFCELESNETIDQQTAICRCYKPCVYGGEPLEDGQRVSRDDISAFNSQDIQRSRWG